MWLMALAIALGDLVTAHPCGAFGNDPPSPSVEVGRATNVQHDLGGAVNVAHQFDHVVIDVIARQAVIEDRSEMPIAAVE